jgi:hypothetical protein
MRAQWQSIRGHAAAVPLRWFLSPPWRVDSPEEVAMMARSRRGEVRDLLKQIRKNYFGEQQERQPLAKVVLRLR